jgi:hypothetical protein
LPTALRLESGGPAAPVNVGLVAVKTCRAPGVARLDEVDEAHLDALVREVEWRRRAGPFNAGPPQSMTPSRGRTIRRIHH